MRAAGIIIASTRASAGIYEDQCGPIISGWLAERSYNVNWIRVVPDGEPVGTALAELLEQKPSVVITSGGTGLSPDDRTPEITAGFLDGHLPGVMEAIRAAGREKTPMASLSRGCAGTAGGAFVINLPGSPGGVRDGLDVLAPILDHICEQLEGRNAHK